MPYAKAELCNAVVIVTLFIPEIRKRTPERTKKRKNEQENWKMENMEKEKRKQ